MNMRLWAHTLVKNEARWLWFAVTSIIDHVDRLLLWDTGSTDESLEIENLLKKKYPGKIDIKEYGNITAESFADVRQEMLSITESDWFLVLDADEIWWRSSIEALSLEIKKAGEVEAFVVPTVNLVGDIFHCQDESAGRYRFGNIKGHYNLRAVKRSIPGLNSQGVHGVWGWADEKGQQIQNRNTFKIVEAPYMHATFLQRSGSPGGDLEVVKRQSKLKYELGKEFPLDYYYPEVFFQDRPSLIRSPWETMSGAFKFRAFFETPLRKFKRKVWKEEIGY